MGGESLMPTWLPHAKARAPETDGHVTKGSGLNEVEKGAGGDVW